MKKWRVYNTSLCIIFKNLPKFYSYLFNSTPMLTGYSTPILTKYNFIMVLYCFALILGFFDCYNLFSIKISF